MVRASDDQEPAMSPTTEPVTPTETDRYVTLDIDVSGDVEARWVYDCERGTVGLLLRHLD